MLQILYNLTWRMLTSTWSKRNSLDVNILLNKSFSLCLHVRVVRPPVMLNFTSKIRQSYWILFFSKIYPFKNLYLLTYCRSFLKRLLHQGNGKRFVYNHFFWNSVNWLFALAKSLLEVTSMIHFENVKIVENRLI